MALGTHAQARHFCLATRVGPIYAVPFTTHGVLTPGRRAGLVFVAGFHDDVAVAAIGAVALC